MIRYRLEFVGDGRYHGPTPSTGTPRSIVGTLELYGAARYEVVVVDEEANPPRAVPREVRG